MRQSMLMPNWDFRACAQFLQDVFRKHDLYYGGPRFDNQSEDRLFCWGLRSLSQRFTRTFRQYVKVHQDKGKVTPYHAIEDTEGKEWYSLMHSQLWRSMTMSGQRHAKAALPAGKNPEPIILVQEVGLSPAPGWTGVKKRFPASTGVWIPDLPAHSESLHRQRYPDP